MLVEVVGGIATITLNRPDSLNAWTPDMEERWNEVLDDCAADPEVRVVVVTGAGRAFCAGADAGALGRHRGEEAKPTRARPLTAIVDLPKPTVAAVNGPCVGLGLALALCCDVRIAAAGAKLAASFARRGLLAEFHTAALLPAIVGRANALDLLLSGRTVLSEEALTMGLVHRVVPGDGLTAAAAAYAADIAAHCSPEALAGIKAQIRAATLDDAEAVPRLADFAEGMAALPRPAGARLPRHRRPRRRLARPVTDTRAIRLRRSIRR